MSIGIIVVFGLIVFASRIMIFKGHQSSVKRVVAKEGSA